MAKKIRIPRTSNGAEDMKNILAAFALEFPHRLRVSFPIDEHLHALRRIYGEESTSRSTRDGFFYTLADDQRWDYYYPYLFFRTEGDLVLFKFHEHEFK